MKKLDEMIALKADFGWLDIVEDSWLNGLYDYLFFGLGYYHCKLVAGAVASLDDAQPENVGIRNWNYYKF